MSPGGNEGPIPWGKVLARALACLRVKSLSRNQSSILDNFYVVVNIADETKVHCCPKASADGGRRAIHLSRKQSRLCLHLPRGSCLLWHRHRQKPGASDDTQTESLVVPRPFPPPFPSEVVLCVIRPDGEEALWAGQRGWALWAGRRGWALGTSQRDGVKRPCTM